VSGDVREVTLATRLRVAQYTYPWMVSCLGVSRLERVSVATVAWATWSHTCIKLKFQKDKRLKDVKRIIKIAELVVRTQLTSEGRSLSETLDVTVCVTVTDGVGETESIIDIRE
jgi:hypothetical protein